MPLLTKTSPLAVELQQRPLMLAAASGYAVIRDENGIVLARLSVAKAVIKENSIRCVLKAEEATRRGHAAEFAVLSKEGKELWSGTVGTEDANMLVRTTEFIPGVVVSCDELTYTTPYESYD